MHDGQRPTLVYVLIAAGLLSFSASPILVRFASVDAPGLAVAFWRSFFAVLFLLPPALWRWREIAEKNTGRDWLLIVSAGVLLGTHFVLWIQSLYYTTVASAAVLVTMSPVFVAIFSVLFLKERLTRGIILAILVGVPGAVLIGLGDATTDGVAPNPLLGNLLALTGAVIVSVYLLIGRVVRQQRSWIGYVVPLYTVVLLTVFVMTLGFGTELTGYSPSFYGWCMALGIGPSILGHGSFNYALKYVSATLLGVLSLTEPIGSSIIAYFLFAEMPGFLALIGMALVLVAIMCALVPQHWFRRKRVDAEVT